jgi:Skp family chaperone for outer membrane proteins
MNIKMLLTSTVLALASFTAASYAQAATTQYCNPNYHSCEAPFNL